MSLGTDNKLNKIAHPNLLASIDLAFPSCVSIQSATETKAADHSLTETWVDVGGLAELHGILAAATAHEIRIASLTNVSVTHRLDLQCYAPAVTVQHRALVKRDPDDTEETYNITAVQHDSQARYTRLLLEKVSH